MQKQDLVLTQPLKPSTVAEMLTRTAAHYPNSGHTANTLKIVAEDWFHSFAEKTTDRAFIEALTVARRNSKGFFPSELDVFVVLGINPSHDCKVCQYYQNGNCINLKKEGFQPGKCTSFLEQGKSEWVGR